jgi:hypothetical protein
MSEKLTDAQIANWRQLLIPMLGPYALIMPAEQVQAFKDKMQADVDSEAAKTATNGEEV